MAGFAVPLRLERRGPSTLGIDWSDGRRLEYDVRSLRLGCPCAHCVSETTGEPLLDPESVPQDVVPSRIESVGRYGLRFQWSDGHSTGIYTFERLTSWPGARSVEDSAES